MSSRRTYDTQILTVRQVNALNSNNKPTPSTEDLSKIRKAYPQNIPIIYINYPMKQVVYPNQVPNYSNIEIIRNNKSIT